MKKIYFNLNIIFFILSLLVFFFSLILISDYINADGYVHIDKRLCRAESDPYSYHYTYYRLFIFLSDIFSFDVCYFFNSNYFKSDFYDRFTFNELNFFNTGFRLNYPKILISFSLFLILFILIILIKKRSLDDLIVLTSPTIYYGLMSTSTDSLVIFFTFSFYLIFKKLNTFASYAILIPGYFFTDRSFIVTIIYPAFVEIYSRVKKITKYNSYFLFVILCICFYTLAKIITILSPYIPNFFTLFLPSSINVDIENTANSGNFAIFGFFVSFFSTPNLILVNFFQMLFFLYVFFKQKIYKNLNSNSLFSCALIFIFFSTLIGGISMTRHYPIIVIVILYFLLENCNLFQRKIIFILNLFFNLFALIYYFNKGLI